MPFTDENEFEVTIKGKFYAIGREFEEVIDQVREHIVKLKEVKTCISPPSHFTHLIVDDISIKKIKKQGLWF